MIIYKDGIKQDPRTFSYASSLVYVDAGARKGELFPDESGPGVYFEVDEDDKCLKVRKDLGAHVKFAWLPFPFEVSRLSYKDAEFHLFEPNPEFRDDLERKAKYISQFNCTVWVHCLAIGTKTELTKFKLTEGGWGSTICLDKQNEKFIDEIEVQKIDFLTFLNFLNKRCPGLSPVIDIKMDVEGAEYEILEVMFANWDNHCKGVKSLSVEFHRDFFTEKHDKWIAKFYGFIIGVMKKGVTFNWWPGEW
jgi:FkbM family methyltransferase